MSPLDISDEPILIERNAPAPWENGYGVHRKRTRWRAAVVRETVVACVVAALVALVSALGSFQHQFENAWKQGARDFRWTVLVQGTQLEIDEIGRFLHQLDGVDTITFVPADQVLERMKNTGLAGDLAILDQNPFPSEWSITWLPEAIHLDKMEDLGTDTRSFPSVKDIVFDRRLLLDIRLYREFWASAGLTLALVLLLGTVTSVILLGRFLFFVPKRAVQWKRWIAPIVVATATGALSAGITISLLGPSSSWIFLLGAILGLGRCLYASDER